MFPILSGVAAFLFSLYAAWHLASSGLYVAAIGAAIGGLISFALLKTLSEIADHLHTLASRK